MDTEELMAGAAGRIAEHRTAEAELSFVDTKGEPLPGVEARVRLASHEFKLGANAFKCCGIEDAGLQDAYRERFAALLNYATLPFYWGGYEPKRGETGEERLSEMAEWCRERRITPKGHPLVWHEVYPEWAGELDDKDVLERLRARVGEIVSRFRGRVDTWDVVNEATVSHRVENAVGRWIAEEGAAEAVAKALLWAREANPGATLLYNDFNVSEDFEKLVAALQQKGAPVDVIGVQSHMHKGTWSLEKAWTVCETYARFGLPLHFTELTVLSGRLKDPNDNDWHVVKTDWSTTPEGEAAQAAYGEKLYTLLFSHPAVEAVTWWDFSDLQAWQGAPAGLVRKDMTPKPLYDRLVEMFRERWTTDAEVTADADGRAAVRCFFGDHEVTARAASGEELHGRFDLRRAGRRKVEVALT